MKDTKKKSTLFFVETGNWKVSVILEIEKNQIENYDYIEATTLAFETAFSDILDFNGNCELISLLNENGEDYFDPEYTGNLSDVPNVMFGVLTSCYLEKNAKNPAKWWYFLSSEIFENASQPSNVTAAREVEKKWSKQVAQFKLKENELRSLEQHLNPDLKPPKNNKKKKP